MSDHDLVIRGGTVIDGTITAHTILDLFRYSSDGVVESTPTVQAYFSADNGATDLDDFSTTGDPGDWATTAGNDAFDKQSPTGLENGVGTVDVLVMDALGYDMTLSSQNNSTDPQTYVSIAGAGGDFGTAANFEDTTTGQDPATSSPSSADSATIIAGNALQVTGLGSVEQLTLGTAGDAELLICAQLDATQAKMVGEQNTGSDLGPPVVTIETSGSLGVGTLSVDAGGNVAALPGYLLDEGTISAISIIDNGEIVVWPGGLLSASTITVSGDLTIDYDANALFSLDYGTIMATGVTITSSRIIAAFGGYLNGSVTDNGVIAVAGGPGFDLDALPSGSGSVEILPKPAEPEPTGFDPIGLLYSSSARVSSGGGRREPISDGPL